VAVALFSLTGIAHLVGIRLNLSGSIPPGIYRRIDGPIVRGGLVLACLPANVGSFARGREYVPDGSCANGDAPIGKMVVAVEGDTIDVNADGVFVDGRFVPNSAPLPRDSRGRALPVLRVAHRLVEPKEVWLVSSYSPRSFDSRYFGGIAEGTIVSRIRPIITSR